MTNTTKQAENLKTWPKIVYATKSIWGRFPSNVPEYQTEIGEDVFGFDNPDNIPCVEYIRADLVHQITEAARCLGVAQVKNDSEGIKYWTSKVDELTNSDLVKPIQAEPATWQPIASAPRDNKRLLYLARFNDDGTIQELDYDGAWVSDSESWEIPEVYYYWGSANGIQEPTHWAYQDTPPPLYTIRKFQLEAITKTLEAVKCICEEGIDYPLDEADRIRGDVCAAIIKRSQAIDPEEILKVLTL